MSVALNPFIMTLVVIPDMIRVLGIVVLVVSVVFRSVREALFVLDMLKILWVLAGT